MKGCLCYFLSCIYLIGLGQVEGVVFNKDNMEPLAFANISLLNTKRGCVSNEYGAFQLSLSANQKNPVLRISAIGIEPVEIQLSEFTNHDTIWVKNKVIELAALQVYNDLPPAIEIVRIALNKLPDLGYRKPYQLNVFYRHYCSEKDVYGRLIEAAIVLTDNKGHKKKVDKPGDKIGVDVLELRKSYDFTRNFDEHEPISIYSTMKYDVMSYPSILSFYPKEYNFRLVDTSFMDNKMLWVIRYDYDKVSKVKTDTVREKCTGKIYINAADNGVYLIEEHQEGVIEKVYETQTMEVNWRAQYQELDGYYFLKYLSETSDSFEELRSTQQEVVQTKNHKAHVEIMVNEIKLYDVNKNTNKEPTQSTLDAMEYHPDFWEEYTMLKSSPIDEKILKDLAKRAELEQQFKGN